MEEAVPQVTTQVSTPSVSYAGFGSRLLAAIIDGIILGVAVTMINIPLALIGGGSDSPSPLSFLSFPLMMAITWGYAIYFIGSSGATLGKKALKIKVIKLDGTKLTYMDAFLREIVGKFVSGFIFPIGHLWMLWDSKKQTVHDKIAKTLVVKA